MSNDLEMMLASITHWDGEVRSAPWCSHGDGACHGWKPGWYVETAPGNGSAGWDGPYETEAETAARARECEAEIRELET